MNYQEFFEKFAQYGHLPSSMCRPTKSLYPLLQTTIARRLSAPLEDEPIPFSSIPLACFLGEPIDKSYNILQGTLLLTIFNALRLLTASLKLQYVDQNSGELNAEEITNLNSFFSCASTFCQLSPQYLIFEGSDETIVNNLAQFLSVFIEHIYEGDQLNALTESSSAYFTHILTLFKPVFDESSSIAQNLPLFIQFLADNEAFVLLQVLSGDVSLIPQCQEYLKQIALYFSTGSQVDESSQTKYAETASILHQYSDYLQQLIGSLTTDQPLASLRVVLMTTVATTAMSLASELFTTVPSFLTTNFDVDPGSDKIDPSYKSSFLSILGMILKGSVSDEIFKTLILQINNQTSDSEIQYYCSAASYFEDQKIGYFAMLGSFLPFPYQDAQEYHKSFTKIMSKLFSKIFQTEFEKIDFSQLSEPVQIALNESLQSQACNLQAGPNSNFTFNGSLEHQKFSLVDALRAFTLIEGANGNNLDLIRITTAWLYSTAAGLQAAILRLTKEIVELYEANMKFEVPVYNDIASVFAPILQFTPKAGTIQPFHELLQNVAIIVPKLQSLLKEIIAFSPLSLGKMSDQNQVDQDENDFNQQAFMNSIPKYNRDVSTIIGDIKGALEFFKELKEALKPASTLPSELARCEILLLLQDTYTQVSSLQQVIVEQPENFTSVFTELRAKTFIFSVITNFASSALPTLETTLKGTLEFNDTLLNISDAQQLLQIIPNYANEMQTLHSALSGSSLSKNLTQSLNFSSPASVSNVLSYISDPQIRAHTENLILYAQSHFLHKVLKTQSSRNSGNVSNANDLNDELFEKENENEALIANLLMENLKLVVQSRIDSPTVFGQVPDFENITAVEFVANLTDDRFLREACEILCGKNAEENVATIQRFYTYVQPIEALISDFENHRISVEDLISRAKETFGIELPLESPLEHLKVQTTVIKLGVFDDNKLNAYLTRIETQPDFESDLSEVILDFLSTAAAFGSFDEENMRAITDLLDAEAVYQANPNSINKRNVIGALCQLPLDFEAKGKLDDRWKQILSQAQRVSNFYTNSCKNSHRGLGSNASNKSNTSHSGSRLGFNFTLPSNYNFSSQNPFAKIRDLIGDNFVETITETVNIEVLSDIVKKARVDSIIQDMNKSFSNFVKATQSFDLTSLTDQIAEVQNQLNNLKKIDSSIPIIAIGERALQTGKTVTKSLLEPTISTNSTTSPNSNSTISEISNLGNLEISSRSANARKHFVESEESQNLQKELFDLKKAFTEFRETVGILPSEASVALMAATNDYLCEKIGYNQAKEQGKSISTESLVIKNTRDLSFAIKHILQSNSNTNSHAKANSEAKTKTSMNEKGITKAAKDIGQITQLFYLIHNSKPELGQGLKEKVESSCKLMKEAVINLIQSLGVENQEVSQIAKELLENLEKFQNESQTTAGTVATPRKPEAPKKPSKQFEVTVDSYIVERFNAEALVLKRKKEVEVAQAEMDRLLSLEVSSQN